LPADQSRAAEQLNLAGIRVLAVDDRADARELLEIVLAQYGADALIVDSGHEALAALSNFRPQVLLCDIGMPDMDGYTLMRTIRNLPPDQGGDIPAIAVTAFAKDEDARRALHHGYQAHIPKPIEPGKLVSTILELVN
jgi:CheY-like chemotaxis protein